MAKKWADVVGSEAFQALPDNEKEAAREQYFNSVVAPQVPEDDIETARKQFFSSTSLAPPKQAPAKKAQVQTTDSAPAVSDPMGGLLPSAIAGATAPKKQSVLEGMTMPPPLPTEDKMLRPEFVASVEAQLNALPEEKRRAAVERMAQRPDVYGRAAKVVAGRYAALDKAAKTQAPTLRRLDPRLEAQTERFMEQGMEPEAARNLARQQAMSGEFRPDLQQMRPDIEGEIADAEAARQREALKDAGFFGRVGAETKAQYEQAGLGLMNVFADLTGNEQLQKDISGASRMVAAGQAAIPKGTGVFERSAQGAISSLAGQTPMIALSMVMGTPAPVLLQAGVQQFGNSYGEARAAGQSPEAAAARAIPMAAAEVIFERFGMEQAMAGLRKFVANAAKRGEKITGNEIAEYIGKAVAKEIPSEMATTLTQYGIDVVPGVGLNRNPSVADLYQQLEETLRQTIIQAGVQSGVTLGAAKGLEKLSSALTPERTPYERDRSYEGRAALEAMARGFLTPERRQEVAPPVDLGPLGRERPGAATREERLAALTAEIESTGIPEDDARVQAEQTLIAQEAKEQEALAPRIAELTQEYIDSGMEPQAANQLAVAQAKEEAQADAQAQREGAVESTTAQRRATRASSGVAGQPGAVPPAGGVGVPQSSGVVPAGQDVAGAAVGAGAQPTSVDEHPAVKLAREKAAEAEALRSGAVDLTAARAQQQAAQQTITSDFARLQELAAQGRVDLGEVQDIQNRLQRGEDPMRVARDIARLTQEAGTRQAPGISEEGVAPQAVGEAANVPSAEAPKAKRGRPAVLTEEEKQQRAEAKKPTQAAKARAERSLARLTKTLDTLAAPPVEDDFDTDEEYQEALNEHKGKRREAVKELLLLNADPSIRGTKVGERIKAALARPDITAKEKADLQAGIDAQKRAAAAAQTLGPSASRVTKGAPDNAFTKFTNGVQALGHIIKTGNDFQKALGKRLRGFVTGVRFVVIEEGQELPAQLQTPKNARHWERSIALYIENYKTGDRVIYVRGASFGENQGLNNLTILHELLHAATNRKISLAIEAIKRGADFDSPLVRSASDLLRTMNSAAQTFNEMARTGRLPEYIALLADKGEIFDDPREFIAYGMTDPEFQKFLMEAKGYEEDTSFFNRFVRGIRELFGMDEDTTNAFTDLIIVTDTILSSRAPQVDLKGEAVSQTAKGEEAPLEQVLRPLPPVLVARGAKAPSLKRRIDALLRRRKAGQLTDTQFAEEVDAIADAVESSKYQKVIPKRQRGADYIRQRILEAKRRGDISPEAADLAEWFILQNPALVDDLSISFRQATEGGVGGQYMDIPRIARIIKEKANTGTIVHEVLHHLERMMPEPIRNAIRKEWYRQFLKAQDKAADDNQKKFFELLNDYHSETGVEAQFKAATTMLKEGMVPIEFYQYVNPSEFWAVNGTRIVEGNFAGVQGGLLAKLKNWLGKTAQKLKALFGLSSDAPIIRALESLSKSDGEFVTTKLLQEEGVYQSVTPEKPSEEIEKADRTQKELNRAVQVANHKFEESQNGEEYSKAVSILQMMQDPRKVAPAIRDLYNRMGEGAREALTRVMTTDFIADLAEQDVPELKNTDRLLQQMSGLTQQLLKAAGDLTNDIARAFRKDPTLRAKLDKITHVATLAEYDPADLINNKVRNKDLDQQYEALGPEGQRIYNRIKKHYENLSNYFSKLLDDQITQSGLPMAEQANLIKKIRAIYETGTKITPYFPLVRRGDYWLSIGKGDTRKFFMYETMGERDRAMRAFADEKVKQKPGESAAAFEKRRADNLEQLLGDEDFVYGNDISALRRATVGNSQLLTGVFAEIDQVAPGTNFSPEAREQLKDAVYQIYLQTMPEQSFRKQFIHRKGYAGFRTDLLRNVADTTTKMATQLARIKYAPKLRNSLSQARDSIRNRPQFGPYVSAFERRVSDALSAGKPSLAERIAGMSNRMSFIYYLGGISSAMLQPLSLFQTGIPVLMKYGTGNAYAEVGRMLKVWQEFGVMRRNPDGSYSWVPPSVEYAVRSADERRAIKDMLGRDLTTSTYARDALDYKAEPTDKISSPTVQFGKDTVSALVLGGLMHSTERLSREAMFLAAYRLNRKAGKDHETAVDNAVIDTNEALGNYGEYNRPDFMKGAPGKILTQFMMYPVHVTLFLGRNFVEMIKPMNGRTRWEASKKFFGTMGHTWVLGGAVGLWGFSTVMGLLGAMWNALKDDEWPEDVKSMSFEFWWRTVWLKEQLGGTKIAGYDLADIIERGPVNALTGVDISSRTSLNNMWLRDTKEYATIRESAMAMAMEKAGPTANMILAQAEAIEAFIQGDYKKGVLKAAPAGFRNWINAAIYYQEGAKDNKGAEILSRDAFTTGELIFQAVGFRSDLLANTQYVTFKVIGLEQKINNQRTLIMNQLDRAYRNKDFEAYTEYYGDMQKFNSKYPTYAITPENLVESLERRQEQRGKSFRGVVMTEKNVGPFAEALLPSRIAADEREKKNREKKREE